MKMCCNKNLMFKVLLGLVAVACFLPAQVRAQNSISSFVTCVNGLGANATTTDAVACVPAGCFFTNTASQESAQPACKLRDGTVLPRVIFSCPGVNGSQVLRFRPSFSLCTQGGVIDHVELGQDFRHNDTDDPGFVGFNIQLMADVDMTANTHNGGFSLFLPAPAGSQSPGAAVVDAANNTKNCAECHDRKGTVGTGVTVFNQFGPIPPELAEGTISSNDPFVVATSSADLTAICAGITASTQLQRNPARWAQAKALCSALNAKE